MILTDRDKTVINFIERIPCYSYTIKDLFFKSTRTANRRLEKLYDYKYVNRTREHASKHYFYWGKGKREPADKHKKHYDLIARAYKWIDKFCKDKNYTLLSLEIQKKHGKVKPDLILYLQGEKNGEIVESVLPVEIERGNNIGVTINKYDGSEYKKLLLFSKRPYAKKVYFIELLRYSLSELDK